MLVYHGTNTVVTNPEVRIAGYAKDFGYGFYCTKLERQAQRWAISKRNPHIVSHVRCFGFSQDLSIHLIKSYSVMTKL